MGACRPAFQCVSAVLLSFRHGGYREGGFGIGCVEWSYRTFGRLIYLHFEKLSCDGLQAFRCYHNSPWPPSAPPSTANPLFISRTMRPCTRRSSVFIRNSNAPPKAAGEKYVKRHVERGKLLPRHRVEMLLDEDSYFLEVAPLAGHGMENESPGAGVIGGVGLVCGRECLITANEATLKGGATSEAGLWKNGTAGRYRPHQSSAQHPVG